MRLRLKGTGAPDVTITMIIDHPGIGSFAGLPHSRRRCEPRDGAPFYLGHSSHAWCTGPIPPPIG